LADNIFTPVVSSAVNWAPQLYSKTDAALYPLVVTQVQTYLRTQRRRRLRQP